MKEKINLRVFSSILLCVVLIAVASAIEMILNGSFIWETWVYTIIVIGIGLSVPIIIFQYLFDELVKKMPLVRTNFIKKTSLGFFISLMIAFILMIIDISFNGMNKLDNLSEFMKGYSFFLTPPISVMVSFIIDKKKKNDSPARRPTSKQT